MPAIPNRASRSKQRKPLRGDCCPRLSCPSSYDLFARPTVSALCADISSLVVDRPEFGEGWLQTFL